MENTHIIIFKDNSKKRITQFAFEKIISNSGENQKMVIEGAMYDLNMISKLLPLTEYYSQYPQERPAVMTYEQLFLDEPVRISMNKQQQRESLLGGIEKAVGKNDFYYNVKRQIELKGEVVPSGTS